MLGIGFGLERIGLVAARHPIAATVLLLLATVTAALNIPNVRFDGDITAVLPEESRAYRDYFDQADRFRDFSRDVTILVQSDRLFTASGLEDFRNLQLDLTLVDSVDSVASFFSAPAPDPLTGEIGQFFPDVIADDAEAARLLDNLLEQYPQIGALVSRERNTAVLIVAMKELETGGNASEYGGFAQVREEAGFSAPADFTLHYTGLTPIGITIVAGLLSDQLRLTLVGLALGAAIALALFRSASAAIICAVPPTLTAIWALGLLGFAGVPINYLTTVLPTLALILAFADGIVLYFRWQTNNAQSEDFDANLADALRRVGPASALTSITTVLAFFSFSFASGSALKEFSMLGMAFVALAFLAVIVALPVACHWAVRVRLVRGGKVRAPALRTLGRRFAAFAFARPAMIAVSAIVVTLALVLVHLQIRPEYRIMDYLPSKSDTRKAEQLANEIIGGRSMVTIAVPVEEGTGPAAPANMQRLRQVEAAALQVFPPQSIISILRLTEKVETGHGTERLVDQLGRDQGDGRSSFVSGDEKALLISLRIPSDQPIAATLEQIDDLQARFAPLPFSDAIVVSGFDVLMAQEFTALIDQLRASLMIAIFLGVVIIGIATRSPVLAIAAITPNLLPILTVELGLWLRGGTINMSEVIALTIAFGIAIDNAVHVINVYNHGLRLGRERILALREALHEVGPALGASMIIICVSTLVTQLSVLPMVPIVGQLMIATLIVALLANLAILPANILCLNALRRRFAGRE